MAAYVITWAGVLLPALLFGALGYHELAMILFPLPVAIYWTQGQFWRSLGLIGGAAMCGQLTTGSPRAAAVYVLAAGIGSIMGIVVRRRWPFGWCVAATTVAGCAFFTAKIGPNAAAERQGWSVFLNGLAMQYEKAAGGSGAAAEMFADRVRWFEAHLPYVGPGTLFGMVLLGAAAGVALLARSLRARGLSGGPRGTFGGMRAPEWLIWLAITAAGLYFIDTRWPNEVLRAVAWNTALGLTFVYWLNGFSILTYGLTVFKLPPLAGFALMALFVLSMHPIMSAAGLFDTWWNVRRRFDAIVAARIAQRPPDHRDV